MIFLIVDATDYVFNMRRTKTVYFVLSSFTDYDNAFRIILVLFCFVNIKQFSNDDGDKIHYITFNSLFNILQTGSITFTPGHGPFVISDYGTADGVNSLGLMSNCVGK